VKRAVKSTVIDSLRRLGLLKVADTGLYAARRLRSGPGNRRFRRAHPDFETPPPHLAFDAYNHVDWQIYRDDGIRHASVIADLIAAELPSGELDVLEWGCGPGRLVRHMREALGGRIRRLVGSDYNRETIAWCRRHLHDIEFVENRLDPPLDLPDRSFDAVYNFSVFTHLSERAQLAWARELWRVLRPNGVLVCTTHGDRHRFLLGSDSDRSAYSSGNAVVQGNYREGRKWFLAFHPPEYVRNRLLADFESVRGLDVDPERAGMTQQIWLARKPSGAPRSAPV